MTDEAVTARQASESGATAAAPATMTLSLASLLDAESQVITERGAATIGIAVEVPEPHASILQSWRRAFGDPAADSIPTHVTLLPPTVIQRGLLDEVEQHLAGVASALSSFTMTLSGTQTFRPVSAVVYIQLTEGGQDCDVLQRQIRRGPLYRDLSFPYHPHVTVAHDIDSAALDRAQETLADYQAEFPVTHFTLFDQDELGGWTPRRRFFFRNEVQRAAAG